MEEVDPLDIEFRIEHSKCNLSFSYQDHGQIV